MRILLTCAAKIISTVIILSKHIMKKLKRLRRIPSQKKTIGIGKQNVVDMFNKLCMHINKQIGLTPGCYSLDYIRGDGYIIIEHTQAGIKHPYGKHRRNKIDMYLSLYMLTKHIENN